MTGAGVLAVALAALATVLAVEQLVELVTRALERRRERPRASWWAGQWFERSMPWPPRRVAPAPAPDAQSDIGSGDAPGPRA